jgi:methionyl-tRNA synthetase
VVTRSAAFVPEKEIFRRGGLFFYNDHHAIWVRDILHTVNPDSLRYFLIAKGPEKRDADFTWGEYVRCHNGELLGAYGNLVNRTLAFISKYCGGAVPAGMLASETD